MSTGTWEVVAGRVIVIQRVTQQQARSYAQDTKGWFIRPMEGTDARRLWNIMHAKKGGRR